MYKKQQGLSLIELMIGMVLGLFLMFGLIRVLITSNQTFSASDNLSRLQENGRVAMGLISTDIRRAGYLGANSEITMITGTEGQIAGTTTCAAAGTVWGQMIDQRIFGSDDVVGNYACIPAGEYLRGDVITTRYASPWVIAAAAADANRLYLKSSMFEGKIFAGNKEANADNIVLDTPQSIHELVANAYFIGNSGRSCNGQAIPALFRITLDASSVPTSEQLIAGIENMQIQYLVGNQYFDANNVADWTLVNAARVWLLIRAECPESGYRDTQTYVMGDANITPNDAFRRQEYSLVTALRN
jgi:type II secretory pathway component PulJ